MISIDSHARSASPASAVRGSGVTAERSPTRRAAPIWTLAMGAALSGQTAVALEEGQRFKDWTVHCEKAEQKQSKRCVIFQTLVDNESKKPVLQMTVGYLGDRGQPVAVLILPLGVALRAGIGIEVDDDEKVRIPYERCEPGGCIGGLALTDELINALKRGKKSQIVVQDARGRTVVLEVSLSGFTAGFDALR